MSTEHTAAPPEAGRGGHVMMLRLRRYAVWSARFWAGVAAGVVLHYTLYRMGMPIQPFIYQAF